MHIVGNTKWIWSRNVVLYISLHRLRTYLRASLALLFFVAPSVSANNGQCTIAWNTHQQPRLELAGNWCAKANDSYGFLKVPALWLNKDIDGRKLGGVSTVQYSINVRHGDLAGAPLSLRLPRPYDSFQLRINGVTKLSTGTFSRDGRVQRYPHYILFSPQGQTTYIELSIANERFVAGGLRDAPIIGFASSLSADRERKLSLQAFESGLLLLMASIQFFHYVARRRAYYVGFFFGLTASTMAVFAGTGGEHWLSYALVPLGIDLDLPFRWAMMAIGAWGMAEYFWNLYPQYTAYAAVKSARIAFASFLICCLVLPPRPLAFVFWGFEAAILILGTYFICVVAKAARNGMADAQIFLASYALMFIAVSHDVVVDYLGLYQGNFAPSAMVICLIAQGLVLARQNAQAHLRADELVTQLQKAEGVKDEFLANTSHELRTPLQSIIGLADNASPRTPSQVREHQKLIADTARRLALLIDDLMDLTRMQQAGIVLQCEDVIVNDELQTMRKLFLPVISHRELVIDVQCDPQLTVYADPRRLRQVLYNLVGNAVKFTASGCINLRAKIVAGDAIELSVKDSGRGMSPEELAIATARYRQGNNSNAGVGLGLSISQALLEAHGSALSIESTLGVGTELSFLLPQGEPCPQGDKAVSDTGALPSDAPVSCKELESGDYILVLDDDSTVLLTLYQLLQSTGKRIVLESHAERALAHIEHRPPLLLVLDLMMPEVSGLDVLAALRQRFSAEQLPIIVLSARRQDADHYKALTLGANDYLLKPCEPLELIQRVSAQLALRNHQGLLEQSNDSLATPRELLVELMASAIDHWQAQGGSRIQLAEQSGHWRVQLDGSTARSRTFDRYTSVETLPKRPNVEKVLATAKFVLQSQTVAAPDLRAAIQQIETKLLRTRLAFNA